MTDRTRLAVAAPAGQRPANEVASTAPATTALGSDEIRNLLPHRWPFLYLDRVLEVQPGRNATGLKNVTVSEPFFAGHFPERSIMPGVLLIEALAQLAGIVIATEGHDERGESRKIEGSGRAYLAAVKSARFRHPVVPGDQVVLHVSKSHAVSGLVEFRADARVHGRPVATGTLVLAI